MLTNDSPKLNLMISKNGAGWSTDRCPCTLATMVAEVERMIAFDRDSIAKYGDKARNALWVRGFYQGFDANGKTAVVSQPTVVEIEQDAECYRKGTVLARWVGGERVL